MTSQQIGNLEEYIDVNNQLLESYRNLVKIQQDKIDNLEALLDLTEKAKEGYKELYLKALEEVLLLKNTPKGCSTCKHVYCRGDRDPCRSCNRCITNSCTTKVLSDKWEPKVCDETIEGLQSEIDASRKDDSHIKA